MSGKILVVDDSITLRTSVKFTLEKKGYKIIQAEHGKAGLDKLEKEGKVDLIISDINMPVMDGITFIKEVKKTSHRFTPILILTTESEPEKKKEGKKAGAAGWLVKPFKNNQLVKIAQKFVR